MTERKQSATRPCSYRMSKYQQRVRNQKTGRQQSSRRPRPPHKSECLRSDENISGKSEERFDRNHHFTTHKSPASCHLHVASDRSGVRETVCAASNDVALHMTKQQGGKYCPNWQHTLRPAIPGTHMAMKIQTNAMHMQR